MWTVADLLAPEEDLAASLLTTGVAEARSGLYAAWRAQATKAPRDWRERIPSLFPKYVSAGFAPHHEELWEWVQSIELDTAPRPFVLVLARGGGKSTSAELATTDLGTSGRRRYVLYVRETQDQADASVGNIATLLESDSVAEYFPEHSQKAVGKHGNSRGWRRNRLTTAGGFTVDALGLDTASRGVKFDEQRPDLIILDDIDGKHDTAATTAKKIQTLTSSVLPAGATNVAVLGIQNLIIPDGIFTQLVDGRATFLSRRIVSGPHPAALGLEWEYEDQGPDQPRRAKVIGGTPTWQGQGLEVIQHQIDVWGIDAFLKEAQHEVTDRAEGLALNYEPARHDETVSDAEAVEYVAMGRAFGGIDFQRWRFGFTLEAADRQNRVHQIAEYFSQDEDLEDRARVIHALCTFYKCPPMLRLFGDSANPTDIAEINRAFRTIGSPLKVVGVGRDAKLRRASVERWNNELARDAVFNRQDIALHSTRAIQAIWSTLGYPGSPPDLRGWRLGMNAGKRGTEMYGSRLVWEQQHWSYPVPKAGKAQDGDPDDHTADGADMIAARRYALMSHWNTPRPQRRSLPGTTTRSNV